jgi:hypothetical protein
VSFLLSRTIVVKEVRMSEIPDLLSHFALTKNPSLSVLRISVTFPRVKKAVSGN